jgi:hypothetical protein
VLVENPAHLNLRFPLRERLRPEGRGSMPACHETVGWTTVTGTA